ncbi:EAL domain-containing protein [Rheinheimera sp.]|uniref:EAL domain-containing protein n=1 Tax=Rheinheimera sp. TaxID=1869214 RepID=UPI0027BA67A2|nr:EAL domain-containing protein [Rheinheimera sp.]
MPTNVSNLPDLICQILQDHAFMMVYQPILSLKDHCVVGYEALCRPKLNQPELCKDVETFVQAIEQLGLYQQFDLAVAKAVFNDIQNCAELNHQQHFVHINLCAESLNSQSFCDQLELLLTQYHFADGKIRFEITERSAITDESKDKNLLRLALTGCQFVIDDFITGYSNFGALINPFMSAVKVDQSVTQQLTQNSIADKFMKSLIALLIAIDKNLIIEGVENSAQLEFLRNNQCDFVQGYYLAKPMVKELLPFANNAALLMLDEKHKVPQNSV